MKETTKLTWGLYNIQPRNPFRWIARQCKDAGIMFKRLCFVIKHGYYPQARFETYSYFIDMFEDILIWYRFNRTGTPYILDCYEDYQEEKNKKEYNDLLDKMGYCLSVMKDEEKSWDIRYKARDDFFKDFCENFYSFWD